MTNEDPETTEHEDVERAPDGVPHDVVARMTFASSVLATFTLIALVAVGWGAALAVAAVGVPLMVFALQRRATRERDRVHPSR